jgi:hypothetical protein
VPDRAVDAGCLPSVEELCPFVGLEPVPVSGDLVGSSAMVKAVPFAWAMRHISRAAVESS